MPDAFVTLISVQPAVAIEVTRSRAGDVPQAPPVGSQVGGLYDARRQNQIQRTKSNPPGAK